MQEIEREYNFCYIPNRTPSSNILRDRWYHFYKELINSRSRWRHRYVCICDSKDVVFQDNPFEFVARSFESDEKFVLLFEEGMKHRDSQWNLIDQFEFQRDCREYQIDDFKEWRVINAGTIIGTPQEVANLCLLMWMTYTKTQGRCSDQAALNYLVNGPLSLDGIHITISPFRTPLVLTGEAVLNKHITVKFDGQVYNPMLNERYYLFHQWERTGYRQTILDSYEN